MTASHQQSSTRRPPVEFALLRLKLSLQNARQSAVYTTLSNVSLNDDVAVSYYNVLPPLTLSLPTDRAPGPAVGGVPSWVAATDASFIVSGPHTKIRATAIHS